MEKQTFLSPSIEPESIESLSQKLLEANLQLSNANRELEKLQQERETMLANISHDLRAPITAIRSAIDYLTSGQNIRLEDYESSIRLIDHRTATLENLIQDMYYLFVWKTPQKNWICSQSMPCLSWKNTFTMPQPQVFTMIMK